MASNDKRYAILGDVHSNWEALAAVLEDAARQGATDYLCVGDLVGYNADPAPCLDRLREIGCLAVRGNHDHYCSNEEPLEDFQPLAASVIAWTRRQLSAEQTAYLRALPLTRKLEGFTLVHSTLDMPDRWGYVFDALDAESNFNYQTTAVCFYGHTHLPIVFERQQRVTRSTYSALRLTVGRKYFINVGSVGQPRDGDPRAAYVMFEPRAREVRLLRVAYDVRATQERIRRAALPERLALRLELGK